jgi:Rhodopirellula transposase DDE domain
LRVNRKKLGARHPDRDRQFRYIGYLRQRFRRQGNPIISVDAKKREMAGPFKNAGAKWDRVPTPVNDHDFRSLAEGIAVLYGIYDPHANRGSMFADQGVRRVALRGCRAQTAARRGGIHRPPGRASTMSSTATSWQPAKAKAFRDAADAAKEPITRLGSTHHKTSHATYASRARAKAGRA